MLKSVRLAKEEEDKMATELRNDFIINHHANTLNEADTYLMHPGEPIVRGGRNEPGATLNIPTHGYNHSIPTETRYAAPSGINPFAYTGFPKEHSWE